MNHEAAEKWCDANKFFYYSYKLNDTPAIPGSPGVPGTPMSGATPAREAKPGVDGKTFWDVSGWAWQKDLKKDKVRIHVVAATLEEGVEKAKLRLEEVGK